MIVLYSAAEGCIGLYASVLYTLCEVLNEVPTSFMMFAGSG